MKIHTKYHIKDEHQELEQSYNVGVVNSLRILNTLHIRPKSIHFCQKYKYITMVNHALLFRTSVQYSVILNQKFDLLT